ncbi:putative BsuMI modification methylase subunit YdiO [Microbacterium laevaniformans]|uniref:DNA (cytosine-5-)-methyltransferase n=1 Tax=Microbacterium laevaniformans TaxID=36807 RepID=A0A150HFI4_9MICO|nr:DNA cytosine methyltransferase [Microbacterium laevaniformans]KXZ60558.1 putative BsuMI modification methylase subunit YdiO [Microbacterium laevaniformans]
MAPLHRTTHPLRVRTRPRFESGERSLRIVDLFSGCGGLTLGFAQAARVAGLRLDVRLAVDFDPLATTVYARNFPQAERIETESVEALFDGEIGAELSFAEHRTRSSVGDVDALLGGPPCQGHSNLNNHTRRVDAKNGLYLRMARAAEVLRPRMVLIENVPSVVRDRHDGESVVARTERHLQDFGYRTAQRVVSLADLGVAQTRRRHILLAVGSDGPDPSASLDQVTAGVDHHDLRWAIGDLIDTPDTGLFDRRPVPTKTNLERMQYLLTSGDYELPNHLRPTCHQGSHTYKSMYGRLHWDQPAQTITSGYGSIGQGRYMHPDQPRALTAHEAARIQGFPDYFDFSACPNRSALATMIGNAVPPQLGAAILSQVLRATEDAAASTEDASESADESQSA